MTGDITLTLKGTNTLKSDGPYAALQSNTPPSALCAITINGSGILTAENADSTNNALGIYCQNNTITINGDVAVIAKGKEGDNIAATLDPKNGLIINGTTGEVYGDVTLSENLEIKNDVRLTIDDGKKLTIAEGAKLIIAEGSEVINNGTIENNGTLTVVSRAGLTNNHGAKIINAGTLTVGEDNAPNDECSSLNNYGEIQNENNANIAIAGSATALTNFGSGKVINNGTLTIASGAGLNNYGDVEDATFTNNGTLTVDSGAVLDNYVGGFKSIFTNTGTLTVTESGMLNNATAAEIENTSTGTMNINSDITNDGTITNSGTLTIYDGATLKNNSNAHLGNPGILNVNSGATLNNRGEIKNDGTVNNDGTIYNTDGTINDTTGTVKSTYTIRGEFSAGSTYKVEVGDQEQNVSPTDGNLQVGIPYGDDIAITITDKNGDRFEVELDVRKCSGEIVTNGDNRVTKHITMEGFNPNTDYTFKIGSETKTITTNSSGGYVVKGVETGSRLEMKYLNDDEKQSYIYIGTVNGDITISPNHLEENNRNVLCYPSDGVFTPGVEHKVTIDNIGDPVRADANGRLSISVSKDYAHDIVCTDSVTRDQYELSVGKGDNDTSAPMKRVTSHVTLSGLGLEANTAYDVKVNGESRSFTTDADGKLTLTGIERGQPLTAEITVDGITYVGTIDNVSGDPSLIIEPACAVGIAGDGQKFIPGQSYTVKVDGQPQTVQANDKGALVIHDKLPVGKHTISWTNEITGDVYEFTGEAEEGKPFKGDMTRTTVHASITSKSLHLEANQSYQIQVTIKGSGNTPDRTEIRTVKADSSGKAVITGIPADAVVTVLARVGGAAYVGELEPNEDNAGKDIDLDMREVGPALRFQIGASAEETLDFKLRDMSCASIGLTGYSIRTASDAADAMSAVASAIDFVSDYRGYIGATQNRLEHTRNNLKVMNENITSAESRIRDTDIAKETMTYTKSRILHQASQAMLAQANQLPESVLQLLQ